ncbi:MAG: hemerythrin domain-containing protein [Candidatus Omnitrophota bacterium]|nr:hemerythrin domain-containing protein [Candidatus Omnitrophota bacterium]
MAVTAMLKKDHEVLRRKLEFIETALCVAPQSVFVLREMCHSLTKMLDAHIRREEQALLPYANRVQAILRYRAGEDHADQQQVLRDINTMLLAGIKMPTSTVVNRLSHLIAELREHMAEEEHEVFPAIEKAEEEVQWGAAVPLPPLITEQMSANAVMKAFPVTRAVFEKHGIRCGCEGCECLDELAWRCGLDTQALVKELQEAAAAPASEQTAKLVAASLDSARDAALSAVEGAA